MANPSYRTNAVSMAHCPMYMHSGQYSEVPGDSILGLYGDAFYKFQANSNLNSPPNVGNTQWQCNQKPCTYCEKNTVANAYIGRYHLHNKPQFMPTYGTYYAGVEEVYRRNPYEGIFRVPCNQKISKLHKCM